MNKNDTAKRSDQEWKKALSPEQYEVLRRKGTERAFTGKYYNSKDNGLYLCAGCRSPLFDSDTKFDSGTGWPSYYQPISEQAVDTKDDKSYGTIRTEVLCSSCGGHLGHVFSDGPEPTGLRYCINSISLDFKPSSGSAES
jgi:peptide-methionine (R)-S-oxide reductase